MSRCVRHLKDKTVNSDKIKLKSFPSPKRGRYYAVYKNGSVVKECQSKNEAERVYKSFQKNRSNQGQGIYGKYSYL